MGQSSFINHKVGQLADCCNPCSNAQLRFHSSQTLNPSNQTQSLPSV